MRKKLLIGLIWPLLFTVLYLLFPVPGFPPPPPGSLVSKEPADTESIYRKAYYTQLSRTQIINYYQSKFGLSIKLNHPPEESTSFIRDQTYSSWLEELVHPWKDSLFINGFYPTKATEQINIGGVHYLAKITLHYYPSTIPTRLTVLVFTCVGGYLLIKEYGHA